MTACRRAYTAPMRVLQAFAVVALALAAGCARDDASSHPDPRAEAASSASAPVATPLPPSAEPSAARTAGCAPFAVDEARARAILSALPEVARRLAGAGAKQQIVIVAPPDCAYPYYKMALGEASEPTASLWVGHRVSAVSGAVEGQSMCEDTDFVPYERWAREEAMMNRLFELPEVRGMGRMLEQASGGKVSLVIRADKCPSPGETATDYLFYIGEKHEDHSVRMTTMAVDPATLAISVIGWDQKVIPYAQWASTPAARAYAATKSPPPGKTAAP